jgi:hypothetical protein
MTGLPAGGRGGVIAAALLLGAGTLATAAPAEVGGRIKGSVTNQARREVVAARIIARLSLPDRDVLFLTTSDESGTYRFDRVPAGTYTVRAVRDGYQEVAYEDVEVRPPFRNILDFRMPTVPPPEERLVSEAVRPEPELPATGAAPVPITGMVLGEDGDPLADVEVAFSVGAPPDRHLVFSRGDGSLAYPELRPATYELSVAAPGSIPIRIPRVTVFSGRPLEIQVRLVDFPVEMATRRGLILPPEEPLPPRRWLPIPPADPPAPPPAPEPEG